MIRLSTANLAPENEAELLERCQNIAGLTFQQLAEQVLQRFPNTMVQRKGWVGQAIECALGAEGGSHAGPDFIGLDIELKTLPLKNEAQPAESTFVTTINLTEAYKERWETSVCYQKLKKILWIPVEGAKDIPYAFRRIGQGFIWSPSEQEMMVLQQDWHEHMEAISCGQLDDYDATRGQYLQVRPKGANAKSLCDAIDKDGRKYKTLPRGFYLRPSFTEQLFRRHAFND